VSTLYGRVEDGADKAAVDFGGTGAWSQVSGSNPE